MFLIKQEIFDVIVCKVVDMPRLPGGGLANKRPRFAWAPIPLLRTQTVLGKPLAKCLCNPAIVGLVRGILVKEMHALGWLSMAKANW